MIRTAICLAIFAASPVLAGDVVVRAGTIHSMDPALGTIHGGALLVRDGRVVEIGESVAVPPGAQVVDYGPDAVLVPGFVAATTSYAMGRPSPRTAAPSLSAIDGFSFYGRYDTALSAGVTSAYIAPARGRLIAGQGAVVKLGGEDPARRVLAAPSVLHGSIAADARSVPGFWEPPVPPSVDVGLGYAKPQLPRTAMGAIVALGELLDGLGEVSEEYGDATRDLAELVQRGTPWRMRAGTEGEIRALLEFAAQRGLALVVEGSDVTALLADELAAAGVSVVYEVPFRPNVRGIDRGKSRDSRWPDFSAPAALDAAGVRFAIAHDGSARDLLFAARLAMRGGLTPEAALAAITIAPAEILGAAARVGSLAPGKDADLAVFHGEPLEGGVAAATWLDGELAWEEKTGDTAVVLEVDELHVGDGQVLRPGALLMKNGRLVEVGRRVSRPAGAKVVRGSTAMPGMIDALGHLGLEGSKKSARTDDALAKIMGPGDHVDRRVALAGVTTVVLSPRGGSDSGIPMSAYKPAASGERQVVADPATLRVQWTQPNRLKSGKSVRDTLEKVAKYREKWAEYEQKLAEWMAAPPKAEKEEDEDEEGEDEEAEEEPEDDKKKKKKKKKDDDEEEEADPVTGVWEATLVRPPMTDAVPIRIQLVNTDGAVQGSIRCSALSEDLIEIEGRFDDGALRAKGLGTQGWVTLAGEPKKGELEATLTVAGTELQFEAERTRPDVPRASRPKRHSATEEEQEKGKPQPPKRDGKLEPFLRAIDGEGSIVVAVDREDEILACVDAFAEAGIAPVLYGADGIRYVADQVADRIAGVMLRHRIVEHEYEQGLVFRNRYAELQGAGIRIAFHSMAEEGAADLPAMASYAVANGLSGDGALRALTTDVADMFGIADRVGRLQTGLDADVLLLDGPPLDPATRVLRAWVNGKEILRR